MANEDKELDDFFEGETVAEVETEVETDAKQEVMADKETEDETEVESETASEEETPKSIPMAAYMEEKRKRQELAEKIAKLEALVPKQEETAPDPYEDLEVYNTFMRKQWENEQTESQRRKHIERIEKDRELYLETKDDFAQMEEVFQLMVIKNPKLRDEMIESGNEVKFAYEKASEYYNSLLGTKKADIADELTPAPKKKPNLATINGGRSNIEVEKDEDLEDVFADQKY